MKIRVFWIVISSLLLLSMVLAGCSGTTTTSPATSTMSQPPTTSTSAATTPQTTTAQTGNWWDVFGTPQYGGTLNLQTSSLDNLELDPGNPGGVAYETLFNASWTLDKNDMPMSAWVAPKDEEGILAESWEQTDPTTAIVKIRQGIHWQNKPPVNGREFTADDVAFDFNRMLKDPFFSGMIPYIKNVEAVDKYTVKFTFKQATALAIYDIFAQQVQMVSPEWVNEYGATVFSMPGPPGGAPGGPPGGSPSGAAPGGTSTTGSGSSAPPPTSSTKTPEDWHTYASTGPYTISNFVNGSSLSWSKNQDYYGHDERYPQNQLPYIDTINQIAIPDTSTALAALRTGKIDYIGPQGKGGGVSWQQVKSLKQTNPDIQMWQWPAEGESLSMRVDKSPFTDIRVREALNMAIDRKTIAATHYGGTVDGTPCGLVSPEQAGWFVPYDQWPAQLQQNYSYNPTKAKELLSEAGYPNGFDTDVVAASNDDIDLLQIIQSEFKDIGVNMKIRTMDQFTEMDYVGSGKQDQMSAGQFAGAPIDPWQAISVMKTGDRQNATYNNDSKFDAMYQSIINAQTQAEAMKLTQQADIYSLQQNWMVQTFPITTEVVGSPQLRGYGGEFRPNMFDYARWWMDQSAK